MAPRTTHGAAAAVALLLAVACVHCRPHAADAGARRPRAALAACTPDETARQAALFVSAYQSVHLWTACGDQSWLQQLATTSAKPHHTFLDVGCNKGYETARLFELFAPAASVRPSNLTQLYGSCEAACGHLDCEPPPAPPPANPAATMTSVCVEASHKTFTNTHVAAAALLLLPRHAAPGNHWHVLHRAVSNHSGPHAFPAGCDTELCSVGDAGASTKMVTVKGTTVDDLVAKFGFDYVDYMKVDTEGYDPAVLQGAHRSLAGQRIGVLQFEHHGHNLWQHVNLRDVVAQMKDHGYVCYYDGQPTLARLTDCWDAFYELKQWSNVVCVAGDHDLVAWMEAHSFLHQVRHSP